MREVAVARARHAVGNCVRLISSPWRQYTIAPEQATTIFGCGFGSDGWHHIRRTLEQHDADRAIDPRETTLWRFLKEFCPTSISLLAGIDDEPPLPLFVYPWGTFGSGERVSGKDPATSRFCGPSSDAFVLEELARTLRLYEVVRTEGYRPYAYPNSFIGGTWLVAEDGQRRFVVMQGNHRMAALAHLGMRSIAVRSIRQALPVVRENQLSSWPLVSAGRCSPRHARAVFRYFFEQSGWPVARALGDATPAR